MRKLFVILLASMATLASCDKKTTTTAPKTNNGGGGGGTVDPTTYSQYITCKVDGTTYTAYYADGHTTSLNCVYNSTSQTSFESSADEQTSGSEKLLSDLQFTLYGFKAKGAGVYSCPADLYLDGTLERIVNGSKQRIVYVISHGESMAVSSYNNGIIEGTFDVEVQDENDATKKYRLTEGKFKIKVQ